MPPRILVVGAGITGASLAYYLARRGAAVTVIEAGPCAIIGKRTTDKHGYQAYQVGFGSIRPKLVTKARAGVFAKAKVDPLRTVREVRYDGADLELGAQLKVDVFKEGERVDVTGVSRGLGFAGGLTESGFAGSLASGRLGVSDRGGDFGSVFDFGAIGFFSPRGLVSEPSSSFPSRGFGFFESLDFVSPDCRSSSAGRLAGPDRRVSRSSELRESARGVVTPHAV